MTEKVNLKIEDFEDKKTKADKRYTRFKTSDGWMSAFGVDTIENLKQNVGKMVCVEIAVDAESGFKNLRKFIGIASENAEVKNGIVNAHVERPGETLTLKGNGNSSMFVSYAKDLYIARAPTYNGEPQELMQICIDLVKQAKEAFN